MSKVDFGMSFPAIALSFSGAQTTEQDGSERSRDPKFKAVQRPSFFLPSLAPGALQVRSSACKCAFKSISDCIAEPAEPWLDWRSIKLDGLQYPPFFHSHNHIHGSSLHIRLSALQQRSVVLLHTAQQSVTDSLLFPHTSCILISFRQRLQTPSPCVSLLLRLWLFPSPSAQYTRPRLPQHRMLNVKTAT